MSSILLPAGMAGRVGMGGWVERFLLRKVVVLLVLWESVAEMEGWKSCKMLFAQHCRKCQQWNIQFFEFSFFALRVVPWSATI